MAISEKLLEKMQSENDQLQAQLDDLNMMISIREEELEILRKTAEEATELQSRLEMSAEELEFMQAKLGIQQQKTAGSVKRESALEEELLQSIRNETQLYNLQDRFASSQAALADLESEMAGLPSLVKELAKLRAKVTELESALEIAQMENGFIKEELNEYRRGNTPAPDNRP